MIEVDMSLLQLLAASLLPLAVGLVSKQDASSKLKAVTLAVLAAVVSLVSQAVDNEGLITKDMLIQAINNFVVAAATYYGIWKPTGVAAKVQDKTKNYGID